MSQTIEELREVANGLSGALQLASQENATLKRQIEVLTAFVKDCIDNFDCDSDAHKYGTMCRCCSADKILGEIEKTKKGGGG